MMHPFLIDFETRSKAKLKGKGATSGRRYAEHPSTEVLCAVMNYGGEYYEWTPAQGPLFSSTEVVEIAAAHNAIGFDRHVWRVLGWPEPKRWIDTAELARRAGMRGKLDALGKELLGREKDLVGNRFTIGLSRIKRPASIPPKEWKLLDKLAKTERGVFCELTPETIRRVLDYCRSDVEIMAALWPFIEGWIDLEPELEAAERAIIDRGVCFDVELARGLLAGDRLIAGEALRAAKDALGGVCICGGVGACAWCGREDEDEPESDELDASEVRAPAKFVAALASLGVSIPNAQKGTVEPLLKHVDPRVVAVAKARQAVASIARGKLEAGLLRVSPDGRLRDNTRYYGAHTGRWSGQGMQLQNMPRPSGAPAEWTDEQIGIVADEIKRGDLEWVTEQSIDVLLRACLYAPDGFTFVVADYSSVEARATAWSANDLEALEVFRKKRDVYVNLAARLYNQDYDELLHLAKVVKDPAAKQKRQLGKIGELGLGYGMGAPHLEEWAEGQGINWETAGLDPAEVVAGWRELHAPIVQFWDDLQRAASDAAEGGHATVGLYEFGKVDGDVWLVLPSQRPIVYRRMRFATKADADRANAILRAKGLKGNRKPGSLIYDSPEGVEWTYGGKLTENAIQAMCRCLLADAMVKAEREGLRPVLHVHDELVCEVPIVTATQSLKTLEDKCMKNLPAWARGVPTVRDDFPVGADGYICRRYKKE
jgi:DNA polymerase bacteriophage-type